MKAKSFKKEIGTNVKKVLWGILQRFGTRDEVYFIDSHAYEYGITFAIISQ